MLVAALAAVPPARAATAKPVLHGRHWVAITGKPLAATAGAMMFQKGGNAVDAACAMLAATSTMWDTLGWGGETQALVYNPHTKKVVAVNALGVAPTGATPEFYKSKGMSFPPEFGPLAAVTPGTPAGLIVMLAEWGKLSLKDVLEPAIQMADGYPIEQQLADGARAPEGPPQGVAVLEGGLPAAPRRGARGAAGRARSSARPTSRPPCASSWRRSSRRSRRRRRASRPSSPPTTASTRATSPRSSCAGHPGAGRPHHDGGPRQLEVVPRGAGDDHATRASRSTSSTPGCRGR